MQKNKLISYIKDGNTQLLYFLFILLFIHFTIILPSMHSEKNYEVIGTSESVKNQINLIERQIHIFEMRRDTISSSEALDGLDDKISKLQSQKIEFQKEQIELSKQKVIDRNFNLPIINVTINESTIRTVYPGFILVGLCLLLNKRKKIIDLYASLSYAETRDIDLPIWTTPIPLSLSNEKLSVWQIKNIIGLAIHFLLLYTAFSFILTEMRKEFISIQDLFQGDRDRKFEVLAINIILISAAVGCYLYAIIHTIKIEWTKE